MDETSMNLIFAKLGLLELIPEEMLTEDICMNAVKQDGMQLMFVPGKYKTEAICMAAVKQNGYAMQSVPKNLQTYEMYEQALKAGYGFFIVPQEYKTYQMCLEGIFSFVPLFRNFINILPF